jgi:hypothetical protein
MKHSNHAQHYTPDPVTPAEPSEWSVIGGAAVAAVALYLLTVFAFSL